MRMTVFVGGFVPSTYFASVPSLPRTCPAAPRISSFHLGVPVWAVMMLPRAGGVAGVVSGCVVESRLCVAGAAADSLSAFTTEPPLVFVKTESPVFPLASATVGPNVTFAIAWILMLGTMAVSRGMFRARGVFSPALSGEAFFEVCVSLLFGFRSLVFFSAWLGLDCSTCAYFPVRCCAPPAQWHGGQQRVWERRRGVGARSHGWPPHAVSLGAQCAFECERPSQPKRPHCAPRDQGRGGRGRSTTGAHIRPGCQGPDAVRRSPRLRCGPLCGPQSAGRGNCAGGAQHVFLMAQLPQPVHWPRRSRAVLSPWLRAAFSRSGVLLSLGVVRPMARLLAPVLSVVLVPFFCRVG